MRKSALGAKSHKEYNLNNLEVTGKKITFLIDKKRSPIKRGVINLEPIDVEESHFIQRPSNATQKHLELKQFLRTANKEYTNVEVSNKLLRRIKEASKVEDFERILHSLCQNDDCLSKDCGIRKKQHNRLLRRYEVEQDLYQEFFGRYFDYLWSVVNRENGAREE